MNELADKPLPRGALVGAATLVGSALALAILVRVSGADISSMPALAPIAVSYLRFADRADGAVTVYDSRRNELVQVLPAGTNGFVRATLRIFAHQRRSAGIDASVPFELAAGADGRLVLRDPATGQKIDLEAFGPTNAAVFAGFMRPAASSRSSQ